MIHSPTDHHGTGRDTGLAWVTCACGWRSATYLTGGGPSGCGAQAYERHREGT